MIIIVYGNGEILKKTRMGGKKFIFMKIKILAFFQDFIKNKFLIKLIWIPGGILGNFNDNNLSNIISELKNKFGKNIVIRISFSKKINKDEYKFLISSKFIKIDSKNYANSSMALNLFSKKSLDKLYKKLEAQFKEII